MTIAVAVQVHDGIVLASDSAMTLTDPTSANPTEVTNVYNNANKIFNLHKMLPIGGIMYGMGSMGASSISTLVKDLRKRFTGLDDDHQDWELNPEAFTIGDVAEKARQFLFEETFSHLGVPSSPGVQFGFLVAGYSAHEALSELWQIQIENGDCAAPKLLFDKGITNTYAAGNTEAFRRLVVGYGEKLGEALVKAGVDAAQVPAALEVIKRELFVPLVQPPMPIQDAIDFAEFLVHATSIFTRFKRGAANVGGPVESAAITKHEGFKWVKRKRYFDAVVNPGD